VDCGQPNVGSLRLPRRLHLQIDDLIAFPIEQYLEDAYNDGKEYLNLYIDAVTTGVEYKFYSKESVDSTTDGVAARG